jgi:hypothetical protein
MQTRPLAPISATSKLTRDHGLQARSSPRQDTPRHHAYRPTSAVIWVSALKSEDSLAVDQLLAVNRDQNGSCFTSKKVSL